MNWQGETTVDCKMSWYCIVHVLIPYNIKLYTALRSPLFDYCMRVYIYGVRARARRSSSRVGSGRRSRRSASVDLAASLAVVIIAALPSHLDPELKPTAGARAAVSWPFPAGLNAARQFGRSHGMDCCNNQQSHSSNNPILDESL